MSFWANVRSFGCFAYLDREVPARALLDALVEEFDLASELKISTKNYVLRWRKLSWKAVDEAIANPTTLSIWLLVGSPQDVRLGGAIGLRIDRAFAEEFQSPPLIWLGAESGRWPEPVFTRFARRWLHIAATQGTPFSGGVLAAADLRNAKVEMTCEFEGFPEDKGNATLAAFYEKLRRERAPDGARTMLRRVYPITLLGPRLASQVEREALVAAGATNIESVNGSLIFDATPQLLEAWSPEYLAATAELRRLLWPLSFQNPADDPDLPRKRRR